MDDSSGSFTLELALGCDLGVPEVGKTRRSCLFDDPCFFQTARFFFFASPVRRPPQPGYEILPSLSRVSPIDWQNVPSSC